MKQKKDTSAVPNDRNYTIFTLALRFHLFFCCTMIGTNELIPHQGFTGVV